MSDKTEDLEERQIDPNLVRKIRMFFILLPILAIVLPEGLGRLYLHATVGVPGKSFGMYHYDPETGGTPRPNSYTRTSIINGQGFRNEEDVFSPKPANTRRVITYGGSTTFCYNVLTDESWSLQLQKYLRTQPGHEQDQVLNGGVINWSLGHALIRAKREIPQFKPDYVFVYSGFNEWKNAAHLRHSGIEMKDLVANKEFGVVTKTLSQSSWLLQNSLLYRFYTYYIENPIFIMIKAMKSDPSSKEEEGDQYFIENYVQVLREFNKLTQENGGELVFVTQTALTPDAKTFPWWLSPSNSGADVARELGLTVLKAEDMVSAYRGRREDLFYTSGIHYSKEGNDRLGKFIFGKLFDN